MLLLSARNASVLAEWLMSVGRRDAHGRICHLICEIAARQRALGVDAGYDYLLPLTQEQIGDSTGLTPVHVNRVLQRVRQEKLIETKGNRVRIPNWEALKDAGDFTSGYLHLTSGNVRTNPGVSAADENRYDTNLG